MRQLVKGIIEETNEKRVPKQHGFLRDFNDRRAPHFYFIEEPITFQIECLYKNFKDSVPNSSQNEERKSISHESSESLAFTDSSTC